MARCEAVKADGVQCGHIVGDRSKYCYSHDPARKEQRRRAASKAGSARGPGTEIREIKVRLKELADDVLAGKAARADASVAAQVLGVYLKAVSIELKVREQAELVERLEELEDVMSRKDASGWR